jgi:hypothetical protein
VTSVPFWVAVKVAVVPLGLVIVLLEHDVQVTTTVPDELEHEVPTHTVAVLLTAPEEDVFVAVIVTVVDPLLTDSALTNPLLTLATVGFELLQLVPEVAVRFLVVLSLYVPVAVSC